MKQATSEECCSAFMSWASRYGLPATAISDNGNTFVANLYRDIMKTFGVEVRFTPAYHAATNGAVERRHQTIKNSLKATLVDMGNTHGNKWAKALPWVLMAKRAQVQPINKMSMRTGGYLLLRGIRHVVLLKGISSQLARRLSQSHRK